MMFDVGCLFGKGDLEVTPIFGAYGLVSPGIIWQVDRSSVFNEKVCRAKDIFSGNGSSPASENSLQS